LSKTAKGKYKVDTRWEEGGKKVGRRWGEEIEGDRRSKCRNVVNIIIITINIICCRIGSQ